MMTKDTIQGGTSFFTNGEYLGVLLPPGLFPNPSPTDSMLVAYSLRNGNYIAEKTVKQKHSPETG